MELWEVSPVEIVDAYLAELDAPRRVRPRRRHRVPPHRRHAGGAQGPPAAPGPRRRSSSTRSCCASKSATSCSPACSSARRSRTRPRPLRRPDPPGRAQRAPHRGARRALPLAGARPARAGAARRAAAPPRCGCPPPLPPVVVVDTYHVAPVRASVRDAVESVLRLLPDSEPMSFRELASGAPSRLEVVVRFLAVLELYKQGMVDLSQFTNFGELLVRRLADGETALDARQPRRLGRRAIGTGRPSTISIGDASTPSRRGCTKCDERDPGRRPATKGRQRERADRDRRVERRAIEAVVLAATEPVEPRLLAQLVELPVTQVEELCDELAREYEESGAASCWSRSPAGTATRPIPTSRPTSSASCSTASTRGCRRRRWRRSPSSRTSNRSRAARCRRSAASTSTPRCHALQRGYVQEVGTTRARQTRRSTAPPRVPRTSRSRLARRSPVARRLRPRRVVVEALERGSRTPTHDDPRRRRRRRSGRATSRPDDVHEGRRLRATPRPAARPRTSCRRARAPERRRTAAEGAGARRARFAAASCEELIADGPRHGQRRGRDARPPRRPERRRASSSTACPSSSHDDLVYYLLNKPAGVVSTACDPQGRTTVVELVPAEPRVFPVGRLDYDTEGLLVLTNDGELTHLLTHPSSRCGEDVSRGGRGRSRAPARCARAARGRRARRRPHRARTRAVVQRRDEPCAAVELGIHEGRNRQVRRMCEAVGHPVVRLVRTRIGPVARPSPRSRASGVRSKPRRGAQRCTRRRRRDPLRATASTKPPTNLARR